MSTGSPQPGHTAGGEAPTGNSGHESCWDRGEVQSNRCCSAINPSSPLLLPAGRRGAGGAEAARILCRHTEPWLCRRATRSISLRRRPARREHGAVGQHCRASSCHRHAAAAGPSGAGGGSRGSGSGAPWSWDAGATARSALIELLLLQGDCYFIGLFLAAQPG